MISIFDSIQVIDIFSTSVVVGNNVFVGNNDGGELPLGAFAGNGKFIVQSTDNNGGLVQIGNPNFDNCGIEFIAGVTQFGGDTSLDNWESCAFMGIGGWGYDPTTFVIATQKGSYRASALFTIGLNTAHVATLNNVLDDGAGNLTATYFHGDGSNLTNLPPSSLPNYMSFDSGSIYSDGYGDLTATNFYGYGGYLGGVVTSESDPDFYAWLMGDGFGYGNGNFVSDCGSVVSSQLEYALNGYLLTSDFNSYLPSEMYFDSGAITSDGLGTIVCDRIQGGPYSTWYIDASGNTGFASIAGDGAYVTNVTAVAVTLATSYTVSTLPAGTIGQIAFVTDALAPTYLTPVVGLGGVTCPVFFDGTNWVCH